MDNRSYTCEANHSFDLAKQGYLNLLPVNQKKSKTPGDNEMMIAARRVFLELGFYDPLIESIKEIIQDKLVFENSQFTALDAGCGEGYYSEKALRIEGLKRTIIGTDISKYAVKNAAGKYKDNFYFVSSVFNLPIADKSTDLILSIFSPFEPKEFKRVLAEKGSVIVVSPGPKHLQEMAEMIYDTFRPHENNVIARMDPTMEHCFTKRTTFQIDLQGSEAILALLKMTPYYWSTGIERLEKITSSKELKVTCDFNIAVFGHVNATES